jgi:hypothetical protein
MAFCQIGIGRTLLPDRCRPRRLAITVGVTTLSVALPGDDALVSKTEEGSKKRVIEAASGIFPGGIEILFIGAFSRLEECISKLVYAIRGYVSICFI